MVVDTHASSREEFNQKSSLITSNQTIRNFINDDVLRSRRQRSGLLSQPLTIGSQFSQSVSQMFAMSDHSPHILELPVELLSLIFQSVLTSPLPIPLCPCTASPINPLPYLLIHPMIHAIIAPLFYTTNTFVLDVTGPHAQHVRRSLAAAATATADPTGLLPQQYRRATLLTTPEALGRLASLDLRFDRLRGWLHELVVPMVQEMIVQGSLEHLSVWARHVEPAGHAGGRRPDQDSRDVAMFVRPPLAGLLRVLGDPYLRTARLWVDGRHASAWCRFHARGPCSDDARRLPAEADNGPVEVDWRDIMRTVDPEGRGVAAVWAEDPSVMRPQ